MSIRVRDAAETVALARRRQQSWQQPQLQAAVADIIAAVRAEGDAALYRFSEQFDRVNVRGPGLRVAAADWQRQTERVSGEAREALAVAAAEIRAFHRAERQRLPDSWWDERPDGSRVGQRIEPLRRVGLYVPAGTAPLFSTVLMLAIPAAEAGVNEIVLCTPPQPGGDVHPLVLAAAELAGVRDVYRIGGAQAIAAMAYGTETVPAVDLIAGPGNVYVTTAKKLVFGDVGIDGLMGPSELAVLAEPGDGCPPAAWIAADLLSQAEHDEWAAVYLVTTSAELAAGVQAEIGRQLARLERRETAQAALANWSAVCVVPDVAAGVELVNALAPEHLELLGPGPAAAADAVQAGAVFIGPWSPEVAGDYAAGPSHVLPTTGTARFASGVSVATFLRRQSRLLLSEAGAQRLGRAVTQMAEAEGLAAHAAAMAIRLGGETT